MIKLVRKHKNSKNLYFIAKETKIYLRELNIENLDETKIELPPTKTAKEMKEKAKSKGVKKLKTNWEEKPLHGQYLLEPTMLT